MRKILVVEDNQIVANIYRTKLQAEGFKVEVAADGEAGLAAINHLKPDLVLLDVMLPKQSGVEVLKKVRARPEFQALPVIVFSSSYVSDEAWQAGATQVLTKASYSPKQVVEEVKNILAAAATPRPEAAPSTGASTSSGTPESGLPSVADSDEDAEFKAGLRQTLLTGAPETLAALGGSLQALIKNANDPTILFDLYRKIHAIAGNAGLAGLVNISRLAGAVEALLQELSKKPKQINPSVLQTVAQAINLFPLLFEQGALRAEDISSSAKILVADDEEIARRAVSYALEKAGLWALRVGESTTALKVLMENRFDLALLDIEMPEMNGFELYTKLREVPIHKETPVVFITTQSEYERHAQSPLAAANDLIAKPFSYLELGIKALTLILKRKLGR